MNKSQIRLIQRELITQSHAIGEVDGIYGPKTEKAMHHALSHSNIVPTEWETWSIRRRQTAYIQLCATRRGIDAGPIDGYWGPQTEFAYGELEYFQEYGELRRPWRQVEKTESNPNGWPHELHDELVRHYGEPGEHLVTLQLPYAMKLSWNKHETVRTISCHEKVHDSLERVFSRVLAHYGQELISTLRLDLYGGCFNKRRKRGGTAWSLHAWGIALDFDPEHNPLDYGRDRAAFAKPQYDDWWRLWEEEGWTSLGRTKNYDWMHVQATQREGVL